MRRWGQTTPSLAQGPAVSSYRRNGATETDRRSCRNPLGEVLLLAPTHIFDKKTWGEREREEGGCVYRENGKTRISTYTIIKTKFIWQ